MSETAESMDWVVRRELERYLLANPGAHARRVWPAVSAAATHRMGEPVTEPVVAGIFWTMHDEGLVDYSGRGTLWLINPKS